MGGGIRFSPAAYSSQLRTAREAPAVYAGSERQSDSQQDFQRLAEDMRGYLSMAHGSTEEEKRQYNEQLNRAVLGYAEDREHILAVIADRLLRQRIHDLPGLNHHYGTLAEALFAEVIGLNVLELVLREREGLEEIQVVGTRIFVVRDGRCQPSAYRFESEREVERIQQNLVLYNNDRINPRKRWAEVMLRDGTRVTMTGFGFTASPTLTLRFYTVRRFRLEELCDPRYGTMSPQLREMALAVLKARFNLVIIGPTNSGKTHLIKALIGELPDEERLVTIEGRHELMLKRDFPEKNVIEYETDEDDAQHRSAQAFKLALRQSPQRIIHAEIRDEDANIYVRACTRGHSGSMTTVHASALEDVPEAIADMCMLDGRGMDPLRLTKRVAEYVTQIGIEMRFAAGKRRLVRMAEIGWRDGEITTRDWAVFDPAAETWTYPLPPSERAAARFEYAGVRFGWAQSVPERAEPDHAKSELIQRERADPDRANLNQTKLDRASPGRIKPDYAEPDRPEAAWRIESEGSAVI